MHNKGVSYDPIPEFVTEWRRFMVFLLVEKHKSIFHLLESGLFDIVAPFFTPTIEQRQEDGIYEIPAHIPGNFWWTTVRHLRTLNRVPYGNKLACELNFITQGTSQLSVHAMDSKVHRLFTDARYPRSSYTNTSETDSLPLNDYLLQNERACSHISVNVCHPPGFRSRMYSDASGKVCGSSSHDLYYYGSCG